MTHLHRFPPDLELRPEEIPGHGSAGSDHHHPTIDMERFPSDIAGFIACEENDPRCDVFRFSEDPAGMVLAIASVCFSFSVRHRRLDETRCNTIGRYPARSNLPGQRFRHADESGLRRGVIVLPGIAEDAAD